MARLSILLCLLLLTGITFGQKKSLELEKVSSATFDLAKTQKTVGIEEIGRLYFKYAKGASLTLGQSGGNGYTWFSILEKTGRVFVTDSLKAAGLILKINAIQNDIEFKSVLYRNVAGKVKKMSLDEGSLTITHQGDTSFYNIDLKSAQPNDILQLSYSVNSRISYTPRWTMINELSPGTVSRFDLYMPSYLEYKIAFKGFRADQIKSSSEETKQIITIDQQRAYIPTKSAIEQVSIDVKIIRGMYTFNSPSKLKYLEATLVQETPVE